jgi:hypothetical protein
MKKIFFSADRIICSLLILLCSSGCLKDKITRTYQIQTPVYQTLTQARALIKSAQATDFQNQGKICVYKNYLFLNETSKGIHVIDNTDPASPRNISFINIPGNTDLSIKDDVLYANESYGDLVAMDIEDPTNVSIKKFIPGIFESYYGYISPGGNPDSIEVITSWIIKDTTVNYDPGNNNILVPAAGGACLNCQFLSSAPAAAGTGSTGTNGSTSAFAILDNYLYAISLNGLNVVDISTAGNPLLANQITLNDNYETIYPFQNKLFMGSNNGMFIYDVSQPSAPVLQGVFAHVENCDPVIADQLHAFVTLRSGTSCQGFTNELDILDITNLKNPVLLKTYPLTNPRGLSKDGDLLFICDGNDGLKIYDAADINNLTLIKRIGGFESNDVIAMNGIAIVIATDGLYQFDYSDSNHIHLISKL